MLSRDRCAPDPSALLILFLCRPMAVLGPGALCRHGLRAVAPAVGTASAPSLPKRYRLMVAGQPMVLHTLAAFSGVSRLLGTLVAVAAGDHFLDAYAHPSFFRVECGGPTRADTVLGGVEGAAGARRAATGLGAGARCGPLPHHLGADRRLIDTCATDGVGGLLAHQAGRHAENLD